MDIVCPDCAAVYEIEDASVTESGRKVRCAACSTVWRVFPPGYDPATGEKLPDVPAVAEAPTLRESTDEAVASPALTEQPEIAADSDAADARRTAAAVAADDPAPPTPSPRRAKWSRYTPSVGQGISIKGKLLGWPAGAMAAAILITIAGLHQRQRVVKYLPQTAGLYAAIGLPVNLRGITINNVASRMIDDNGVTVLIIDGDLINTTDQSVRLPRLRFAVLGKDRQEIYAWSAQTDQTSLKPGEKINFRRRLAAPPADGQDVSVRFITASDITAGFK